MTIEISTIKNGLRVATDYMGSVETVTISIAVDVGSRHEEGKVNGISHFIEHMAFKGTEKRNAEQIAEEFDYIGGHFNAYTSRERTVYYAKVLKENVEVAMDILSDILQNSIFAEDEIERERDVILQEIAGCEDTPDDIIFDYFQEKAFGDTALGRSILGPKQIVKKLGRDDLLDYVKQYYYAENMVMSVAGNISHDETIKLAEKYFNNLASGKVTKHEVAQYHGGIYHQEKDLEQVNMVLGFKTVNREHADYYTMNLLASILGDGMSSRLFQEVREKKGLAYSVYSFASSYVDTGIFGVFTATDEAKAGEALKTICTELKKATKDITEKEIQKSFNAYKASLLMGQENSISRSRRLANNLLSYGRYKDNDEIIAALGKVTKADLERVMQDILKSKPTFAAIGKLSKLQDLDFAALI